ncbi:uncharacterized protein LOC116614087 [Nematostella vectensis]|uniref:uncharacterized protein LOC116614087 n=1 Tax=Nematostella vectensis TaxID=45351 RepID=UPI00207788B0|nr:uncharacterized protein LOC116614087 [Nematostella vectensis]
MQKIWYAKKSATLDRPRRVTYAKPKMDKTISGLEQTIPNSYTPSPESSRKETVIQGNYNDEGDQTDSVQISEHAQSSESTGSELSVNLDPIYEEINFRKMSIELESDVDTQKADGATLGYVCGPEGDSMAQNLPTNLNEDDDELYESMSDVSLKETDTNIEPASLVRTTSFGEQRRSWKESKGGIPELSGNNRWVKRSQSLGEIYQHSRNQLRNNLAVLSEQSRKSEAYSGSKTPPPVPPRRDTKSKLTSGTREIPPVFRGVCSKDSVLVAVPRSPAMSRKVRSLSDARKNTKFHDQKSLRSFSLDTGEQHYENFRQNRVNPEETSSDSDSENIYDTPVQHNGDLTTVTMDTQRSYGEVTMAMKCQTPTCSCGQKDPGFVIPSDVSGLKVREVTQCLMQINACALAEVFERNLIDGEMLVSLDDDSLAALGVHSRFLRLKLLKFASGWRPNL